MQALGTPCIQAFLHLLPAGGLLWAFTDVAPLTVGLAKGVAPTAASSALQARCIHARDMCQLLLAACSDCLGLLQGHELHSMHNHVAQLEACCVAVQVMAFFGALLYADVKLVVAWVVCCPSILRAALELRQVSAVLQLHAWVQ